MSGGAAAPQNGAELRTRVCELAARLGLKWNTEVTAGRRVWGAVRRIDVVLTDPRTGRRLGVECKYQGIGGSAEEKIPATIKDMEFWPVAGIVVIAGDGFSRNMQAYLLASGKVVWLDDLEAWLRLYFSLEIDG